MERVLISCGANTSPRTKLPESWRSWSKVIVISPHSDDAALSLAGVLYVLSRRGAAIEIITCFSKSEYTHLSSPLTRENATALRRGEDERFGDILGQRCTLSWLDQLDAPLRDYAASEICAARSIPDHELSIVGEIEGRVRDRVSLNCALFAPLGLGNHIDHCIARQAVIPLVRDPTLSILFYEELPYAAFRSPAKNRESADLFGREIGGTLSPHVLSGRGLGEIKRRAILCYSSQKEAAVVGDFVDTRGDRISERVWEFLRP
jgi:LmbE family N-acetylglucosaminyl deacetylase